MPTARFAPRWSLLFALAALPSVATNAAVAEPAAAAAAAAEPAAPAESPRAVIQRLTRELETLVAKEKALPALHAAIAKIVSGQIDYEEMGRRALGETYTGQSDAERATFRELLAKMVERSYVDRFEPGRKVDVQIAEKVRTGKGGRAQVKTVVKVGKTRADVAYSLHPVQGKWMIYDIVVDEASQLSGYRTSFRKIVKSAGWKGLIARMRKSAAGDAK